MFTGGNYRVLTHSHVITPVSLGGGAWGVVATIRHTTFVSPEAPLVASSHETPSLTAFE